VFGLSDADFWDMTPRSYSAIQKAHARVNYGVGDPDPEEQAEVEARRIHAKFTVMAAQRARKERDGASPAGR
jgi:hypothetical protein